MKKGDTVKIVKIPSGLPADSQGVFELCLGKCFPVEGVEADGRVELLVGALLGEPDYLHSIYMWPDEIEPVEISN